MYIDTKVLNFTIYSGSFWLVVVDHENKSLNKYLIVYKYKMMVITTSIY